MPKRLPTTALTVQPRLTAEQMSFSNTRKPLIMVQSEVSVGPVLRRAPPRETQERPRHDATRREHLEQLLQVTTKILYANTTEDKRVSGMMTTTLVIFYISNKISTISKITKIYNNRLIHIKNIIYLQYSIT